jgi:hypothetical protein
MANIFVSYANEDRPRARLIAEALERRGWTVWWDRRIPPGRIFDEVIDEELSAAQCVLVLWSAAATSSKWVKAEASEASDRGVLVPVMIDRVRIPLEFRRLQAADLTDWTGKEPHEGFETLVQAIRHTLEEVTPKPAAQPGDVASTGAAGPAIGPAPSSARRRRPLRLTVLVALIVVPLLGIAAVLYFMLRGERVLELGRVSIVSDSEAFVASLRTFLQQHGATVTALRTEELGDLPVNQPDLVIVGPDTQRFWSSQSRSVLSSVFGPYKVVGIGWSGATLFSLLDLELGNVMHSDAATASVEQASLLSEPLKVPAPKQVEINAASERADVVGVYDSGSPGLAGFEGIARWPKEEHHWPIARQGNFLLWGFPASVDEWTPAARLLFLNLLVNHRKQPSLHLEQARRVRRFVEPGSWADRLTAGFPRGERLFQVGTPGRIHVRVAWRPAVHPLALILNGPGQMGAFARKDGPSPLMIDFDVSPEHVHRGTDWRVSLGSFEPIGQEGIDYELELAFPR